MIDAPLALAFTAGMVATVNPCGFAMLPAYLGYFLGREGTATDGDTTGGASSSLLRALGVGAVVSAGFLLLFAMAGMAISWTSFRIGEVSPWLTVAIGAVVAVVGLGFVFGWEPRVALPRLDRGGQDRGLGSMFLFGVSYAVASLSCTLPAFSSVVASTFSRESFWAGLATFVAYGLGMALLLLVLTLALALAQQGMVARLRSVLPYVQRISGAIMALMGAYLVWYGIYEIRLLQQGRPVGSSGPVRTVTSWSAGISDRLAGLDPVQVALLLSLVVAGAVLVVLLRVGRDDGPGSAGAVGSKDRSTP